MTARVTDPRTSHEACKKLNNVAVSKILQELQGKAHGATAQELEEYTGIRLNTVSTTLSALNKKGVIAKAGYDRKRLEQSEYNNVKPHKWSTVYCMPEEQEQVAKSLSLQEKLGNNFRIFKVRKSEEHETIEQDVWFLSFKYEGKWYVSEECAFRKSYMESIAEGFDEETKVFKRTIKVKV